MRVLAVDAGAHSPQSVRSRIFFGFEVRQPLPHGRGSMQRRRSRSTSYNSFLNWDLGVCAPDLEAELTAMMLA